MKNIWLIRLCLIFVSLLSFDCFGQETFQLVAPGVTTPAFAVIHPSGMLLIRDAANQETMYRLDDRFDSADAQWIGYYSRQARQAIQWPTSNRGPVRIGSMDKSSQWAFRTSRMVIQGQRSSDPIIEILPDDVQSPTMNGIQFNGNTLNVNAGVGGTNFVFPTDPRQPPVPIQLGMGNHNRRQFLARNSFGSLGLVPQSSLGNQSWYIVPLANGLARIQYYDNQSWLGLGCDTDSQFLDLSAVGGNSNQLWRVASCPGSAGAYTFENIAFPGMGLSLIGNGLQLSPINYSPYQQWWPVAPSLPIGLPIVQPLYRSLTNEVIANPPLPPARVILENTHTDTLMVLVTDLRGGAAPQKIRIPSGSSELVRLDRDSGASIVETFEVQSPNGFWDRRESRTAIPPSSLYDISTYEIFLQSIAIDRTGSSPDPIEDINYQPRSIGLFVVPPGVQLSDNGVLDVYRTASAARNPGAVRRLQTEDYEKPKASEPVDPLRSILKEFEGKRATF